MKFYLPRKGEKQQPDRKMREQRLLLLLLFCNTILFATVYFAVPQVFFFRYLPHVYIAIAAALGIWFVFYNRGFSRRNVTPDMLPDAMTEEEKQAWIEDGRTRFRRSRWVLTVILPIILTFLLDLLYLFFYPMVEGLFK